MGILKKIYPALLSLLLTGCYGDFTPEIDTTPVLCINSLIISGEPIDISVTHTWLYSDWDNAKSHQVDDAMVSIYANDNCVNHDYIPQEGDKIVIIAESPTYGKAEAETVVPVSVPIESLKWEAKVIDSISWSVSENIYRVYTISFKARMTVSDPVNTVNYYKFSYQSFHNNIEENSDEPDKDPPFKFNAGTFSYRAEPIFAEHIGVFDAINGSDSNGFTFFTDRQFSGKSYTLNLEFNNMRIICRDMELSEDMLNCGLILTLNTVSPSYYKWCNYLWNIDNALIIDYEDFGFSDPTWGYSNVSTGAGVVAAQSHSKYIINLKDFLQKEIFSNQQKSSKQ